MNRWINFSMRYRREHHSVVNIEQFMQNEIVADTDLNLPPEFLKLGTVEISDIGRKPGQLC
ncbi:MAG: hypothetical protein KAR25_03895 [Methanosarcinales archaeon]|nr:hypothetical protein [Methanosarcinales archaeon]